MATKTDLEGERMYRDGLERWYAERGSREFPGVFTFAPLKPPPVGLPLRRARETLTHRPALRFSLPTCRGLSLPA